MFLIFIDDKDILLLNVLFIILGIVFHPPFDLLFVRELKEIYSLHPNVWMFTPMQILDVFFELFCFQK